MSALPRPMTYDDLREMPDDGKRREILGGELIMSPAPSIGHQRVLAKIYMLLLAHIRATGRGEVLIAPVDVRLGRFNVVQPDLVYLSGERPRVADTQNTLDLVPDLVVEVVSPSSGGIDRVRKMALYASSGVREYWIADSVRRTFDMYALVGDDYQEISPDAEGRLASLVLPGLVVDPAEVFSVLE